jgi:rubredoxin/uncharacterized membrane protein (DUF373 family)
VKKYKCSVCGYIYDPEKGDPINGVPPGTPFENLPHSWACPRCGALKPMFHSIGEHILTHNILVSFYKFEDLVYYVIAVVLFISGVSIIGVAVMHFLKGFNIINILNTVNDVLLVIIVMEILSTVLIYLTERRISLTPFILIGLISSIRRILMVSALMSANEAMTDLQWHHSILDLLVSAAIVLVLIISYYLLSRVTAISERCIGCPGYEKREENPPVT